MHRIWLSRVWKKQTRNRKNAFNFSLIFGLILGPNGRKIYKKTAQTQKSLLAPSLETPFWPQGRFWSIFWSRPGPQNEPKPEKITTGRPTFIASKNKTHEFERRGAPGSHFETLLGGSREHSRPHFGDFRRFFGALSQGVPSHNPCLKSGQNQSTIAASLLPAPQPQVRRSRVIVLNPPPLWPASVKPLSTPDHTWEGLALPLVTA